MIRQIIALAALGAATAASAQSSFDPRQLKEEVAGRPNEVLVLGTPHLAGLPASFLPEHLAPLLDRLTAWKPAIITIEAVSGAQCEYLLRYKALYPDTADTYCWDASPARAAAGLDTVAATVEAERLLKNWPASPTAPQRRRLAVVFLAAGDRASALVQWLQLPAAGRHPGEGIDASLAALLDAAQAKHNENYLIAAALAARLGLQRVYPVDDHTADIVTAPDPAFEAAMTRIWTGPASAPRRAGDAATNARLGTPAGTLAAYRYYNAPAQAKLVFDSDFGAALKDSTPQQFGRRYVGWWETRNLRMVANIREAMAAQPGGRTLAIVGASHKGYYEAYLDMMHDVRIADAGTALK